MADTPAGEFSLAYDMTITRDEFLRCLAAAGFVALGTVGDTFEHHDGPRQWQLRLTPLADLSIGLLQLARHRVEFRFRGYTRSEFDAFMKRFDMHFRRGGG